MRIRGGCWHYPAELLQLACSLKLHFARSFALGSSSLLCAEAYVSLRVCTCFVAVAVLYVCCRRTHGWTQLHDAALVRDRVRRELLRAVGRLRARDSSGAPVRVARQLLAAAGHGPLLHVSVCCAAVFGPGRETITGELIIDCSTTRKLAGTSSPHANGCPGGMRQTSRRRRTLPAPT